MFGRMEPASGCKTDNITFRRIYFMVMAAVVLVFVSSTTSFGGLSDDVDSLYRAPSTVEATRYIDRIISSGASWGEVRAKIMEHKFAPRRGGAIVMDSAVCLDNVKRPYLLYVPPSYNHTKATPLIVALHGGVNRANLVENPRQYANTSFFSYMAQENGWIVLFPLGQSGATWFDIVGMSNIKNLIRIVKSEYNIDDDRVWMGGVSDGASAGFGHAMIDPTDYAAFIAINGNMGVPSHDGDLPTYPVNLFNTPIYNISSTHDAIYPSSQMKKTIDMAERAGAKITFKERKGGHHFDKIEEEIPEMTAFLYEHSRDPAPSKIVWESPGGRFGRCFWISVDSASSDPPAPWHENFNAEIIDSSVIIGIYVDDHYSGKGVLVAGIPEAEDTMEVRLRKGDIIVNGNGGKINDLDDLMKFRARLKRGDPYVMQVIRDGEKREITGSIPGPRIYSLIREPNFPSARVIAESNGNRIDIRASRLKKLTIFVNPEMIDLAQVLVISVDGSVVYDKPVIPDLRFSLWNFWENLDRRQLYISEVKITL